jgi:poly-gamma-glutamate synthesis protein (capsule biosynthesis protein)
MAASRRVRRRRRQVAIGSAVVLALIVVLLLTLGGSGPSQPPRPPSHPVSLSHTPVSPTWRGSGQAVTLAFGGDVHFEGPLATGLASDPATALDGVGPLVAGAAVSMANLDTALTDGTCPSPQATQYVFYAPVDGALTALHGAGLSLVTQANNHAVDCGAAQLTAALGVAAARPYPLVGVGSDDTAAYRPYQITVAGQRIAILGASQLFDPGLEATTAASATSPGVASALDEPALVRAVESARKSADTVVVFLTWGDDGRTCPQGAQQSLAHTLVRAGADIVVGSGAHVQQGAGYLGRALVDYGLGNLAFYDFAPPESYSGTLTVTVTGRDVEGYTWRPATLSNGLPQALSGRAAVAAQRRWQGLRACTGLTAGPGAPVDTAASETTVPATTATTAPTGTTSTTAQSGSGGTTTTGAGTGSTAVTDNAGAPVTTATTSSPG